MNARVEGAQPKRWRPVISFWALASGLVFGLGTALMLQQFGMQVLTRAALVRTVVVALVLSVVLPSAAFAIAVLRYNRALRRIGSR